MVLDRSIPDFPSPRRRVADLNKRARVSSSYGRRFVAVRLTPAISKFVDGAR